MALNLEAESTLTDRYQTTVPETVRRALKLGKRDKIHYTITPDGDVILSRVEQENNTDPVLDGFLNFLATDMQQHPERLQVLDVGLVERLESLTSDVEFDLAEPLSEEGE